MHRSPLRHFGSLTHPVPAHGHTRGGHGGPLERRQIQPHQCPRETEDCPHERCTGQDASGQLLPYRHELYLVDLPGYGYARGGRASVEEFEQLTQAYFDPSMREERRVGGVLQLVDSRHPDLPQDQAGYAWLLAVQAPVAIVATKIDKLNRSDHAKALRELKQTLPTPPCCPFPPSKAMGSIKSGRQSAAGSPDDTPMTMNELRSRARRLRHRLSDFFRSGYRASASRASISTISVGWNPCRVQARSRRQRLRLRPSCLMSGGRTASSH